MWASQGKQECLAGAGPPRVLLSTPCGCLPVGMLPGSCEEGRDSHRALLFGDTTLAWLFPSLLAQSNQNLAIAITAGPTTLINVSELPR